VTSKLSKGKITSTSKLKVVGQYEWWAIMEMSVWYRGISQWCHVPRHDLYPKIISQILWYTQYIWVYQYTHSLN